MLNYFFYYYDLFPSFVLQIYIFFLKETWKLENIYDKFT